MKTIIGVIFFVLISFSSGFSQPYSATNQVISPTINGSVTNYGRGFDFTPNVTIQVISLGKRVPINPTQPLTWKIWQVSNQALIHAQTSVATTPTVYTYEPISAPVVLMAGVRYSFTLYGNYQYYYGPSSQINANLTYHTMRYCNGCYATQPFPTTLLNNYHYGNLDFMFTTTLLPIELIQFNVDCQNNKPMLSWSTASEINNDYFTIERSMDAVNFETIGEVSGNGNSSNSINYSWTDDNPLIGTTYYRLKQTDFNGAFEYLGVKTITCEQSNKITIFPSPFRTSFTVQLSESTIYPIIVDVFDYLGRKIHTQILESSVAEIRLSDQLPIGSYVIKVSNNRTQIVEKIIKLK